MTEQVLSRHKFKYADFRIIRTKTKFGQLHFSSIDEGEVERPISKLLAKLNSTRVANFQNYDTAMQERIYMIQLCIHLL